MSFYTNGLPVIGAAQTYPNLRAAAAVGADTYLPSGQNPQVVAVNMVDLAAFVAAVAGNTATAVAGAATLNTLLGTVTSESLTTAAGANYTLTLTNTTVTAALVVRAGAHKKSATTGDCSVVSVTPGAGSCVIVIENTGTAALNGTISISFAVDTN